MLLSIAKYVHGHLCHFGLHNIAECCEAFFVNLADALGEPQGHLGLRTLIPLLGWPGLEFLIGHQFGALP